MWWFKQSVLYFIGLLWMKFCVFVLIQVFPVIVKIGDWALRWTEGNTALQIIFVMLLFPLIMNAIQYYIVDTFIKRKAAVDDEVERFDDEARNELRSDSRDVHGALLEAGSRDDADSDLEDQTTGLDVKPLSRNRSNVRIPSAEYDPSVDGASVSPESSTRVDVSTRPS
jgi:STIMATE family